MTGLYHGRVKVSLEVCEMGIDGRCLKNMNSVTNVYKL